MKENQTEFIQFISDEHCAVEGSYKETVGIYRKGFKFIK